MNFRVVWLVLQFIGKGHRLIFLLETLSACLHNCTRDKVCFLRPRTFKSSFAWDAGYRRKSLKSINGIDLSFSSVLTLHIVAVSYMLVVLSKSSAQETKPLLPYERFHKAAKAMYCAKNFSWWL